MVDKKTQETKADEQPEPTTGLYPTKSNKIVKPISIKPDEQSESDSDSKEPVAKSPKPASDIAKTTPKLKSTLASKNDTLGASPVETSDEETADDNATQVPDVEAESKPEFVDEGQYHITVPKKNRPKKKSSLSRLMWVIFIVFLMVIAVYLYTDIFGVDLSEINSGFNDLIGM